MSFWDPSSVNGWLQKSHGFTQRCHYIASTVQDRDKLSVACLMGISLVLFSGPISSDLE